MSCSFYLYRFRNYVSYGFPIIHFCNPGIRYETPCNYTEGYTIFLLFVNCIVFLHFAFYYGRQVPTFQINFLPPFSGQKTGVWW